MKLTRKSYKRKIIAFGVASFISLSLIATGFASWVLAGSAEKTDEGQITVGTTTEKAIEISDISYLGNVKNFVFEPQEGDVSGRVRYDGEKAESLSITFSCTVTAASFVKMLTVDFVMPDGVTEAVNEGYIIAPEVDIVLDVTTVQDSAGGQLNFSNGEAGAGEWSFTKGVDDKATLSVTLNFGWGEKFEGENPSIYLDSGEGRTAYPTHNEVKAVLDTFKAVMLGKTYDEYIALSEDEVTALEAALKYTVNINAET